MFRSGHFLGERLLVCEGGNRMIKCVLFAFSLYVVFFFKQQLVSHRPSYFLRAVFVEMAKFGSYPDRSNTPQVVKNFKTLLTTYMQGQPAFHVSHRHLLSKSVHTQKVHICSESLQIPFCFSYLATQSSPCYEPYRSLHPLFSFIVYAYI